MKKPFKKLHGSRVVIENTFVKGQEETKSSIELLPETQKEKDKEKLFSTERFKILQVGEDVKDQFKEGEEVLIENAVRVLNPETAVSVIEEGKVLGFIVPARQIAGTF